MILRLSTLRRLISLVGGALVLAALGCLREQHRHRGVFEIVDTTDLVYHLLCLVIAGLGIDAAGYSKRILEPRTALRITAGALAMLIFHQMLEESVFERYRYREFKEYVYFTADLLALTASPVLWGCVLVRCQDALNPRSRKFGRTLAILLTIVLALKFYTVLSDGGYSSWMHFLAINLEPRYLFRTSLRFLPTVCLLRAVVTEMLPVRSPRQAGLRARSVAWDLIGWYVSLSGWWVYRVLFSMFKYQSFGRLFWTGLLMHALVLLIALAAFFALSRQEPEPPFATDIA